MTGTDWQKAACRNHPQDLWFAFHETDLRAAVRICTGCPIRTDCHDHATDSDERYGVWGGVERTPHRLIIRCPSCGAKRPMAKLDDRWTQCVHCDDLDRANQARKAFRQLRTHWQPQGHPR
jgi:ribosomal protein S27AE